MDSLTNKIRREFSVDLDVSRCYCFMWKEQRRGEEKTCRDAFERTGMKANWRKTVYLGMNKNDNGDKA